MMFPKETDKLQSLLGMNSNFKGELNVKGTLRVDGTVDGKLDADCLILSETAMVKGSATAKKIIIGGKINGNVFAHELVEVKSKGKVWGDIITPKLTIIEGGEVNGKIEMKREESKVIGFECKGREAG
ncbi:MAG: polymer-forming cytoskeletal protein [Deltaproteobacteria bacterium]|nr:polymer-forming cytoskeletal protein [Deltaproteobacteria bacterium]